MIFEELVIGGAFLIWPERLEDDRGFFSRTYCVREFLEHGVDSRIVQSSISHNRRKGTLRGLHYQDAPHQENKLVACTRGAIYDVMVDLRATSLTKGRWFAVTLTADEGVTLFVPKGCAHGFLTLTDDAVVRYDISEYYQPESARGLRYDDPAFQVDWPSSPTVISARDLAFPPYSETTLASSI